MTVYTQRTCTNTKFGRSPRPVKTNSCFMLRYLPLSRFMRSKQRDIRIALELLLVTATVLFCIKLYLLRLQDYWVNRNKQPRTSYSQSPVKKIVISQLEAKSFYHECPLSKMDPFDEAIRPVSSIADVYPPSLLIWTMESLLKLNVIPTLK